MTIRWRPVHGLLLGLAACGTSAVASSGGATADAAVSGDISTTPASCTGQPDVPACGPPLDVATADDLYAEIAKLTEVADTTVSPAFGAALVPSRDVRVQANIELDAAKLRATNALCEPDGGLRICFDWVFAPEKPFHTSQYPLNGALEQRAIGTVYPRGVSCALAASTELGGDGCDRLTIAAGTIVRLQRVLELDAFGRVAHHYVRFVRACATACAPDEVRCAASTTCLVGGKDYCRLCGGLAASVCACRDRCAPKPDGTKCAYWTSDDTQGSGTCDAGTCPFL